jgi:molecular chaperone DnaK
MGRRRAEISDEEMLVTYPVRGDASGPVTIDIHGRALTPEEISAAILKKLKGDAEAYFGEAISRAVITVPAYFNDAQRTATKRAGELAGLYVERIVNEPTAAALAYGLDKLKERAKIAVYDFGGGTFDLSILELSDGVFQVLSTSGDTRLGGDDLDRKIIDFLVEQIRIDGGPDAAGDLAMLSRIREAAEQCKIKLSTELEVEVALPFLRQDYSFVYEFARSQLEKLTRDIITRTRAHCLRALADAQLSPADIDEIILVGGQSRMPLVQQRIQEHFGRPARKGVHPDECVALGAALLGDSLDAIDSVTLVDVLSMPIGIATPTNHFRKILDKNQTIPSTKSFRLPPPREPGQPIEIDIYQGDSDFIVDNEFLGSIRLPAAATGRRIDFKLDEECLLKVSFDDPVKGMTEIDLATRDTPEALRKALADDARKREAERGPGAPGEPEKRGGIFGWLKRS